MSSYLRYLGKAFLAVLALCGLAAWPVHALAGRAGLAAFGVGAGVCLLGAAIGRIPHLFFKGPDAIFHASMAGVGARLLGTLVLATPLLFLTGLPRLPLAAGLVLTYLMLLVLEVRDLMAVSRVEASPPTGPVEPSPTANPTANGVPTR
jgi:hypothetical protein